MPADPARPETLDPAHLDEIERLARRGVDEAKQFHFERSAQVGVSPFALLALIALAREGQAAREKAARIMADDAEFIKSLKSNKDLPISTPLAAKAERSVE